MLIVGTVMSSEAFKKMQMFCACIKYSLWKKWKLTCMTDENKGHDSAYFNSLIFDFGTQNTLIKMIHILISVWSLI